MIHASGFRYPGVSGGGTITGYFGIDRRPGKAVEIVYTDV
jgi:hypothetical protein